MRGGLIAYRQGYSVRNADRNCPRAAPPKIDKSAGVWESPTMLITMDAKRRLTVPAAAEDFKPGDTFEANFDLEESEIVFRKVNKDQNWVDVMLRCPVPMDDLPPRSRELPKELDV